MKSVIVTTLLLSTVVLRAKVERGFIAGVVTTMR
ncbi:hypothetical protein DES52_103220 [Deinococcus yavapaiensis KR-236]|uniref:Uncharacterized protein n=1 Tax=Deinococcus yavapaiensis KR-236 TaxID=694435 RepID=A0A318S8M7_9DEIO|nr:hypothetical protein DES52_103220 [Deinococcus yavapaiensis KR-236]